MADSNKHSAIGIYNYRQTVKPTLISRFLLITVKMDTNEFQDSLLSSKWFNR